MTTTKTLLAAAVAAGLALPAAAATVSTNATPPTFDGKLGAPTSTTNDFNLNLQGSVGGQYRTPWEGLANETTGYYNSVQANSTATYDFGGDLNKFGIMWGSPDNYNTLELFNDGNLVFSIDGNDMAITTTSGFVSGRGFVNVHITDVVFDTAVLSSGANAFEYSNVAPVPLPAAAWTFLAALGGLGYLGRKRREA